MISMDFSNVKGREPLPEGEYDMTINRVEATVSSTGKDMLKVAFEESESGNYVWTNYVIQDNCLWKLKELLDAVGMDTSGALDFDESELVGQQVLVRVTQEEYNGQIKNNVAKVMAL